MEKSNNTLGSSSFHEKVESSNEGLLWLPSPNERLIQESRKSNLTQTCNPDLSIQMDVKNDSFVNASMYDSFDDSLDENAQAHVSPRKINASDFLSEQVNVTLRKVRDRQKLKGSYLCDSLEDICSLVSNMDHFSSSDELENINNILEKHGICEDSLRNDICCNRGASLTDQNFDDDSLAILEAEKHFEDSLEDADVASCVDSLMILGSSIGDVDVTVDKIGLDHCGMKTSVEIIYENAPLSSDDSYRTAENFLSEKNSPSLSDRPMSRDSLEEIHDISEMVSEMSSNIPLKTDASISKMGDIENTSLPNSFLENLSDSKVVRSSELNSGTHDRFSNAESERASSVVNSCYFYDTFCIDESIDMPLENTNPKHSGFNKSSIGAESLPEKSTSQSSVAVNSEGLKNTSNNNETIAALHAESEVGGLSKSLVQTNSEIKHTTQSITLSLDSVNNETALPRSEDKATTDTCKEASCISAEFESYLQKPNNIIVSNNSDEKVIKVKLEKSLVAPKISRSDLEIKEISLPTLSDNQLSKNIPNKSDHGNVSAISIARRDKLNLNLQIELSIDKNQDVNVVSISSPVQKSCSDILLAEECCLVSKSKNEVSKIEVFNLKAHQFKNACADIKTDVLDKIVSEAHKKMPTLPFSTKESINNYCKFQLSPGEMPNPNLNMKVNVNLGLKALDLHDSFYDFRERSRIQSRDSLIPLNLCIRDKQLEGKENISCGFKSPESKQKSFKSREPVTNSGHKNLSGSRDRKAGKTPTVTKIPVRKAESHFVIPVNQKQIKPDIKTSPCCGKAKKIPLVKSTSIDSIGKTTPVETPKKHHFCTVRNSICRVPKSKEKPNPKKFQNIQSPVAMYVGNVRSPLRSTYRCDGNQISTPSKIKGKGLNDANTLLSPTVKK